ncbi:MAG: segregation and condensation protein A [Thermonemataceae bacterium]
MSFEIKLPLFEGPFDLLLFFIERDELDIYDIPISQITEDFLAYLQQLETLNIEVASEFILVAASLMRIKAKLLLPRPELDEEGNEIDPREDLIKHLLEYKKYKSVIGEISQLEEARQQKEARGNVVKEIKKLSAINNVEAELQDLDLYKLLRVYEKVIDRYRVQSKKSMHTIYKYPFTVEEQKTFLLNKLEAKQRLSFTDILEINAWKVAVVFNFLAILELLQLGDVRIQIGLGYNNFWIEKGGYSEAQPTEAEDKTR